MNGRKFKMPSMSHVKKKEILRAKAVLGHHSIVKIKNIANEVSLSNQKSSLSASFSSEFAKLESIFVI
jgi:hypothetical protein